MALTPWEGIKVVGKTIEKLGTDGEAFEDANPGEKFTVSKSYLIELLVEAAKELGVEIMD